eukprot:m.122607 g.122607  ORF g.122607 m.122607 type:complete len:638 (-) comp19669_c0_seq1:54-1967(-)
MASAAPAAPAAAAGLPKWSIRERQSAALKKMLGAQPTAEDSDLPPQADWKVLVYDEYGQDIISPLLTVAELRDLGVTVYMQLQSQREPMPDVPAVYFVTPTPANVTRICDDLKANMYESYELNFLNALTREYLDAIASAAVEGNCVHSVARVFDMYCNFVTLEEDFFVSRHRNTESISYKAISNPEAKDSDIEACMDDIVDSLFSVLVTLGTMPIIRCSRRNAAENIAKRLESVLRDHHRNSRSTLFSDSMSATGSFQRPVLIVLDRNVDLTTVLHHTWTYQALVHDLLDLKLNRVTLEEDVKAADGRLVRRELKTHDLEKADVFWLRNRGRPFPEVAGAIEDELRIYREKAEEIKNMSTEDAAGEDDLLAQSTAKLTSAVSSLPQLREQKKILDLHTNMLTEVMSKLGARHLDSYYEMEEEIMNKKKLSKPLLELLSDPEAGTPDDRMRMYIIYFMDNDVAQEEADRCEAVLRSAGCDMAALDYLREVKRLNRLSHQPAITASHNESLFSHASRVMKIGGEIWKQGVKKLLPTSGNLPITRIVDSLMEMKETELTKDYLYLDPKQPRSSGEAPRGRPPFEEAIVFVVGGSNYTEHQNLVDYCDRAQVRKRILFGTSELVAPREFLAQLTALGRSVE